MSNNQIKSVNGNGKMIFDEMRYGEGETGEYWSARELQKALGYSSWQKFELLINKAKISFKKSMVANYYDINYHFSQVVKMISTGKGAKRQVKDCNLSRYACYFNQAVRETIYNQQGFYPEEFPPEEDTERVQKRLLDNEKGLLR